MSGILSSLIVVGAFFLFVLRVRRRPPANAQLLFTLALIAATGAELLLFATNADRVLSPLLLVVVSVVLGPRLGRSLVQRFGNPRLLIHTLAPIGIMLNAAAIWTAFATFKLDGNFNIPAVVLLATAGIASITTAERLHEDRYKPKTS